mmetsp:Transcript_58551/g.166586  ORF Transcript_58551/g.166586 Transcript_58551/m.166586 type:complete len:235 (+) Transcript_58551:85-789(+)
MHAGGGRSGAVPIEPPAGRRAARESAAALCRTQAAARPPVCFDTGKQMPTLPPRSRHCALVEAGMRSAMKKEMKSRTRARVGSRAPCCPRSSGTGPSGEDRRGTQVGVLLEIALEQLRQAGRRLLELTLGLPVLLPRLQRLESLERNVLYPRRRHLQAKDRHLLPLHTIQGAVVDGVDELSCVLQAHAAANTIRPAGPARVHKVRGRSALLELRSQHLRVNVGVPHQKGGTETR